MLFTCTSRVLSCGLIVSVLLAFLENLFRRVMYLPVPPPPQKKKKKQNKTSTQINDVIEGL
jgi:hypothetical protein